LQVVEWGAKFSDLGTEIYSVGKSVGKSILKSSSEGISQGWNVINTVRLNIKEARELEKAVMGPIREEKRFNILKEKELEAVMSAAENAKAAAERAAEEQAQREAEIDAMEPEDFFDEDGEFIWSAEEEKANDKLLKKIAKKSNLAFERKVMADNELERAQQANAVLEAIKDTVGIKEFGELMQGRKRNETNTEFYFRVSKDVIADIERRLEVIIKYDKKNKEVKTLNVKEGRENKAKLDKENLKNSGPTPKPTGEE
jgi:hypothetical protein